MSLATLRIETLSSLRTLRRLQKNLETTVISMLVLGKLIWCTKQKFKLTCEGALLCHEKKSKCKTLNMFVAQKNHKVRNIVWLAKTIKENIFEYII